MNEKQKFDQEVAYNIVQLGQDKAIQNNAMNWVSDTAKFNYSYNFEWLGRPIIQVPQDIVAMQELIFRIKPDLIIETGIAHGGSLILSASMLALLDMQDAILDQQTIDPSQSSRKVLGIDIDIRQHNRQAIEAHPMHSRIMMLEGSSTSDAIINQVKNISKDYQTVLVCLDSNHTHNHVMAELEAYAPLVSKDSYCVVFDTVIEDMAEDIFPNRPWGKGNNPKTAVWEYLKTHPEFQIDKSMHHKLAITVAPDGYLHRIK